MEIGLNFNIHLRRFQFFKLRFYLATFHVLGLMRLNFEKSKNKVFLTPYSVTVARMVGLFFFYIHCHTIYFQYKKELNILPIVFLLSLLVQPRTVIEKRVRLINQFLEISQYYYYRQKFKIPWTLPVVVYINLKITSKIMLQQSEIKKIQLILHPISFLSFLIIYMTTDLLSTGISILTNYFEIVNDEMNEITRMLPIAILQKDKRMVKKLHRRTIILKETHDYLTLITRKVFTNLIFHLTIMVILNINCFFANLFGFSLNQLIVSNSLRYFIYSLDKLLVRSFEWQGIPWCHMAHQYEFENILGHYEGLERTPYIRKDLDWANRLSNQSLVHHLIRRKFNILGMFSPTRRFLCKVVFAIISLWLLRKIMGLAE